MHCSLCLRSAVVRYAREGTSTRWWCQLTHLTSYLSNALRPRPRPRCFFSRRNLQGRIIWNSSSLYSARVQLPPYSRLPTYCISLLIAPSVPTCPTSLALVTARSTTNRHTYPPSRSLNKQTNRTRFYPYHEPEPPTRQPKLPSTLEDRPSIGRIASDTTLPRASHNATPTTRRLPRTNVSVSGTRVGATNGAHPWS